MLLAYYGDVSCLRADGAGLPPMSAYRLDRLRRAKSLLRRQQGIGAELLLCRALQTAYPGVELPPAISVNSYGKPFFTDKNMFFSLSHSGAVAFCAMCDSNIGADVQRIGEHKPALAARFFAEGEREYISSCGDKDAAFTRVWSMKESYIKALGLGMSLPLRDFDVCPGGKLCQSLGEHSFWNTEVEGCIFSLCVLKSSAKPDVFEKIDIK